MSAVTKRTTHRVLTDDVVLNLRKTAARGNGPNDTYFAKKLGVSHATIASAIRGRTFKHLNSLAQPVKREVKLDDKHIRAREMVKEGKGYKEIAAALDVSVSTLSNWCSDIPKNHPSALDHLKPQVRELYNQGEIGVIEIANRFGLSRVTVSRWCRDLRLTKKSEAKVKKVIANRLNPSDRPAEAPFADYYLFLYEKPKDNITQVVLIHKQSRRRISISLARYRMSVHLGRTLGPDEFVVRAEGYSEELDNLRLLNREEYKEYRHQKAKRTCVECGSDFIGRRKTQTTCSNTCRGKQMSVRRKSETRVYTRTCEICEEEFKAISPHADVCRKKNCRDIVAQYSE